MTADDHRLTGVTWRKASRSATNGACVEVAQGTGVFGVRDSKNREGGRLILPATAWAGFLTDTKSLPDR
jgi:Domain of unknown function (DUF397)